MERKERLLREGKGWGGRRRNHSGVSVCLGRRGEGSQRDRERETEERVSCGKGENGDDHAFGIITFITFNGYTNPSMTLCISPKRWT